jgi:hypothetical protein
VGVGVCKAGTQTCNAQGTGYGACTGEVLPSLYDCATRVDESCTGNTPACSGTALWAKGYGGPTDEEATTAAVDSSGNILVGGYSSEAINFGCGVVTTATTGQTPVLFKLDPAGNCLWSKAFAVTGAATGDAVNSVGVDAAGNVYIEVTYTGTVDLGGGPLTSTGSSDIAVAKYDTNGNYQWGNGYTDAVLAAGGGIAVDPSGNVLVAGSFAGTLNFGGGSIASTGGENAFVAKFTTAGAFVWAHPYGNGGPQVAFGVAADASGNVLVTGTNFGVMNFGCGALTSAGAGDVFIAKLTPSGACAWSKGYGDASNQAGRGIVSDALGDVIVAGYYQGTVNFGGGSSTSQAANDAWLLKLDPSGNFLWDVFAGGPSNQTGLSVTVDASNNVAFGGEIQGTAGFGSGTLTGTTAGAAFAAKYDPAGNYLWAYAYGNTALTNGMAFDPSGNLIVVGTSGVTGGAASTGVINFGTGAVAGFGGEDIFVAKLGP